MNDHPLDDPKLKIKRAKGHIKDLNETINVFSRSHPYKIVEEIDPKTSDILVKVRLTTRLPSEIKGIAGDVISNLRSALDQVACALAVANNRGTSGVYFPTADSREEFELPRTQEKIEKLSADAIQLICSLEPYKGGKGQVVPQSVACQPSKLDRPLKHNDHVHRGERDG